MGQAVGLPEGFELDDLPEGFELDTPETTTQAPAKRPLWRQAYDTLQAPADASAHILTGVLGQVAGGVSGLGALATLQGPEKAANVARSVSGALTYNPQSPEGRALTNVATYPFRTFAEGANTLGERVAEKTNPATGAFLNTALNAAPMVLGARGLPKTQIRAPVVAEPVAAAARDVGLSLTPERAGGPMGKLMQGVSGSAKLERTISTKNAPLVNEVAARQIGAPDLTPEGLFQAEAPHLAVYDRVSKVGKVGVDDAFRAEINKVADKTGASSFGFDTPAEISTLKQGYSGVSAFDAADAVAQIRQLRRDAGQNIGSPYNPNQQALGRAQRQIADALENQLDRHIKADGGLPANLIDQYREARRGIAQVESVRRNLVDTDLSAKKLSKEGYLTGDLKTIADAARKYDRSFQDVSKIRDSGPLSVVDYLLGAGGGVANPALLSAVLARPGIRSVLASDAYQSAGIGKGRNALEVRPEALTAPLPALQNDAYQKLVQAGIEPQLAQQIAQMR